jgi:3-oxoacyl-(acyl-carrier-protein) synthase III
MDVSEIIDLLNELEDVDTAPQTPLSAESVDVSLISLGFDSLDIMNAVAKIARRHSIRVDYQQVVDSRNLTELTTYINTLLPASQEKDRSVSELARAEQDGRGHPTVAVLAGVGSWLPPTVVSNADLASRLGVTDEWIQKRTGIRQRHVCLPGMSTSDLAVEAGRRALESAGVDKIDLVLVATSTPDHPIPATAPAVATRLGQTGAAAFDVNAVCAGFIYALATGAAMISSGLAATALVIGVDVYSSIVRPDDIDTAPLFGDGAGAVVLRAGHIGEPGVLTEFDLGSDGNHANLIMIPGGGSRQRSGNTPAAANDMYFTMQGRAVFSAAVEHMATSSRAVLNRLGRRPAEVDKIVGHQANIRILRAVAKELGLPEDRAVINIDRVANTSAASIPLALSDALEDGNIRAGEMVLLTAFGGGLAWGSTALVWPTIRHVP